MRFPLRVKVGIYAAIISVIALAVTVPTTHAIISRKLVEDLDAQLQRDVERVFQELNERNEKLADPDYNLTREFLPQHLRLRLLRVSNPKGELYRSTNWNGFAPDTLAPGMSTVLINSEDKERNCRIATVTRDNRTVSVGTRMGAIEGPQDALAAAFKLTIPLGFLLVLAGATWMARRALKPIGDMSAAAERISAGRPSERLPVPRTNDEIERLSRVLNASFDRMELAYESSEQFSSAASHQLKTPLTILRAGLTELRGCDYLKPDDRENVESLLQQTRRLTTLCEDLLLLAQADAKRLDLEPEVLDLVPILRRAIDDMDVLGMDTNLSVEHDLPLELLAKADPRRISIVMQNLGDNAVKYNRTDGKIRVIARAENGQAIVLVASTGPCIAPVDTDRIFERFNRGKTGENVKGHGLGLSIARELARAHGGDLRLVRSDAEWTEFELALPLAKAD